MSKKHRPDPYKFAQAHHFDQNLCDTVLKLCWKQGSGIDMHHHQYLSLVRHVQEICEENSQPTFKREIQEIDLFCDSDISDEEL